LATSLWFDQYQSAANPLTKIARDSPQQFSGGC
jgi:hypothetical protein